MAEQPPSLGPLVGAVQDQIAPIVTARPQPEPPPRWNPVIRILFRFSAIYFLLYFLPFPLSLVPRAAMPAFQFRDTAILQPFRFIATQAGQLLGWYERQVNAVVVWVGENILGLAEGAIIIQRTGSGDTLLSYTKAFTFVCIAALATIVWTAADFRRPSYQRAHALLHSYMRYALAAILFGYGYAKLPPMQFSMPGPDRLINTYGQSSPMGLLWTFMGASPAYTMFAGLAEIIPAILLLFRRTRTLGAIMSAGVMTNVVLLNFCYDVPVKLFSSHLLLASLVLLLPDYKRLLNVFILNRPAEPARIAIRWPRPWMRWSALGIKSCVIVVLLVFGAWGAWISWEQRGSSKNLPPLYGMYEIESFKAEGEELPPLLTDKLRWRRFIVSRWGTAVIQAMDDRRQFFGLAYDQTAKTLKLQGGRDESAQTFGDFTCTEPAPGQLLLEGQMHGKPVTITLRKAGDDAFLLTSRGFHWIQEMPFNR